MTIHINVIEEKDVVEIIHRENGRRLGAFLATISAAPTADGDMAVFAVLSDSRRIDFSLNEMSLPCRNDPDFDPYRSIARNVIEFATCGRGLDKRGYQVLSYGPVEGMGLSDFARYIEMTIDHATPH